MGIRVKPVFSQTVSFETNAAFICTNGKAGVSAMVKFDVTFVGQPPSGATQNLTLIEDTSVTFSINATGDQEGSHGVGVVVTKFPEHGTLFRVDATGGAVPLGATQPKGLELVLWPINATASSDFGPEYGAFHLVGPPEIYPVSGDTYQWQVCCWC